MKDVASINPEVLKRAEKFARENATSVSAVIEEALCSYLGPVTASSTPHNGRKIELPTATSLKFKTAEVCDKSYGKLVELLDESISLDKAR